MLYCAAMRRNDLALLYNVHVSRNNPRQILRLSLTPLIRGMGENAWTMPGGRASSVYQTNLLGRDDPQWMQLQLAFVQLSAGFGTVVEFDPDPDGAPELVITI